MQMQLTKLLYSAIPRREHVLMLAAPSIALDLPLKILVWEDKQRQVWISHNSADYLKGRHGLRADLMRNIAVINASVAMVAA